MADDRIAGFVMDERPVLLTKGGLRQLEVELDQLVQVRRAEIAERIRHARDFGDISENAEYTEAKNEQSLVEGRIQTLEAMIRNAVMIEDEPREAGVATVGAQVTVSDEDGDETYAIVGAAEADPLKGRISNESPLGRALLGHRAGDEVEWTLPSGDIGRVTIVSVS
jgi:transcription elongation factor GreA